jgi:hypothetical protein
MIEVVAFVSAIVVVVEIRVIEALVVRIRNLSQFPPALHGALLSYRECH